MSPTSQLTSKQGVHHHEKLLKTRQEGTELLSSIGPRMDRTRENSDYCFSDPRSSSAYGLAAVIQPALKERYYLEQNILEFSDPPNGDRLEQSNITRTVFVAFKRLMAVVLPSIFAQLFAECIIAANVLTVSRLNDPEKTAGIGLAMIFVNLCCQSICFGLN